VIDLHTHSLRSDGSEPPARVAELAAEAGCRAFALTDHDTLDGLPEARRRATELGVELVAGCEVSCAFRGGSAHVLVYFVAEGDSPLHDELVRLRADRAERNRMLTERLADLGVPVDWEEVVRAAGHEENVGRPHFAEVLVAHGAADSIDDAFDRWLGRGRPAHVPKARVSPATVAREASASGGVAVLAHPLTLDMAGDELPGALAELQEAGLVGLEAHYAAYGEEERAHLLALAASLDLVATGGSDYHGRRRPDIRVGTGRGDLDVPDDVLERLGARRPG